MVYDAAHSQILMFGGSNGAPASGVPSFFNDLWSWNGATWSQISAGTGPSARDGAGIAYDGNRQRVVLFGGRGVQGSTTVQLNDTWEWDGTSWRQASTVGPPARAHTALGYDAARRRVVMHGGTTPDGQGVFDTWEWDGTAWAQRASTAPSAFTLPSSLVFDAGKNALLAFVGAIPSGATQLWQWNGSAWTILGAGPTADVPVPIFTTGPNRIVILAEGAGSPQMYSWDGATWSPLAGATPTRRFGSAAAYDVGRQQAVLFGGMSGGTNQVQSDTWIWIGNGWTRSP